MKKFLSITRIHILLIVFLCSLSIGVNGQQGNLHSYGIFYDEDFTLRWVGLKKLNDDRNYTLGLGLHFSYPGLHRSFLFWPLQQLNKGLGATANNGPEAVRSFMLANGSFTPVNISATEPVYNDRPFGSITHLQTSTNYVDNNNYRKYSTTFSVGVIGTYLAREVQSFVHRNTGDRKPNGWHNQISDIWEPTLLASYGKERLINRKSCNALLKRSTDKRLGIEVKHGWRASLGYYTEGNYMFSIRTGRIDPRNWGYDVTPLFGSNKLSGSVTNRYSEYYLFATARPYFTLYNALLNGQFVSSKHTLSFQQTRHLVFEFDAGLAANVVLGKEKDKSIDIKTKFSGHSPEFKLPGATERWHYYIGIDILFHCWK
ncbi:MAG: lipid A-modifier LpxR family protein [Chitinophagaceae bacterium]